MVLAAAVFFDPEAMAAASSPAEVLELGRLPSKRSGDSSPAAAAIASPAAMAQLSAPSAALLRGENNHPVAESTRHRYRDRRRSGLRNRVSADGRSWNGKN
mmetsp:Transcript_19751/g.35926  ORF Transcript_19751/g.35926 Transcript_19751/m.35926 type:complete len:101 (+) Transcript_19751:27-329(+)